MFIMYHSFSANDYKQHFGLPNDYEIAGMLTVGSSYPEREKQHLQAALNKIGKYELRPLPATSSQNEFLAPVQELSINGKVFWYFCAYGGAMLSEFLHFGYLFGARKTVLVGLCGGLKKGEKTGTIIVPTDSFADGSTAHMYDRSHQELQPSDDALSNRLKNACEKEGLTVLRDKTMTCQAMIAETWEDVLSWSQQGYAGVEMEAATVFAVSNHFSKPSGAMLMISDNLIEEETNLGDGFVSSRDERHRIKTLEYKIATQELLS